MIPKKIHYCWFGRNPKPELIRKCIASWEKFCPNWKIIEWNEDNYDIDKASFVKEAYEAEKWAFVSDYARLDILLNEGGVYLDTDVELLKYDPFEKYLMYDNILVFENGRGIASGLFYGTVCGSCLCREMLEQYKEIHYTSEKQMNTSMNKPVFKKAYPTLEWNGKTQIFGNDYIMGCEEYSSFARHYGTRSWCHNLPEYSVRTPNWIIRKLRNPKIFQWLERFSRLGMILKVYQFAVYDLYDLGLEYYIKRNRRKRGS